MRALQPEMENASDLNEVSPWYGLEWLWKRPDSDIFSSGKHSKGMDSNPDCVGLNPYELCDHG